MFELDELRLKGRAAKSPEAREVRALRAADLALLGEEKGSRAEPIKRLMQRHHGLARLLASGVAPGEAAIIMDYSGSRVSLLQADPMFAELVEFYKGEVHDQYREMHERMAGLGADALQELQERMEADPESFSNTMLLDVVKSLADRTGHGPSSTSTNVNVNVDLAGRLQRARERVERFRTIELEVENADEESEANAA